MYLISLGANVSIVSDQVGQRVAHGY